MAHLHYILWKDGAPRFDVRAEKLLQQAEALRKAGLASASVPEGHCNIKDVADFFETYLYMRIFTHTHTLPYPFGYAKKTSYSQ